MAKMLVQINFKYAVTEEQLTEGAAEVVGLIQEVPGLLWKIWIYNDQDKISGGIYLFESEAAAQDYVDGPIVARIKTTPVFSEFTIRQFNIMEPLSEATRAPI